MTTLVPQVRTTSYDGRLYRASNGGEQRSQFSVVACPRFDTNALYYQLRYAPSDAAYG